MKCIEKLKQHPVLNRPVVAWIFFTIWAILMSNLFSIPDWILQLFVPDYPTGICTIICGFVLLAIHKAWFKPDFTGVLKAKHLGRGLLLLWPAYIFVILNAVGPDYANMTATHVIFAIISGVAPGIFEEVAYRGLAGSNFMRLWQDGPHIRLSAVMTAFMFGITHLGNIFVGADPLATMIQVIYAFGMGLLFCAVYYRTGTLWPAIILHSAIDVGQALDNTELILTEGADLSGNLFLIGCGILFSAWAIFLLRNQKIAEINAVWRERWGAADQQSSSGEGVAPQ